MCKRVCGSAVTARSHPDAARPQIPARYSASARSRAPWHRRPGLHLLAAHRGGRTSLSCKTSEQCPKVTEGLTITCLRPGAGDRIDVVFANKDEANKAKQHTRWLTSSLTGARVKSEQWYPVKCDSVVKQCVLDGEKDDERTLKKDFLRRLQGRYRERRHRWHRNEGNLAQQGGRGEEGRISRDVAEEQGRYRLPLANQSGDVRSNRRLLLTLCDQGQQRAVLQLQQVWTQTSFLHQPDQVRELFQRPFQGRLYQQGQPEMSGVWRQTYSVRLVLQTAPAALQTSRAAKGERET